jgi:sigma-B regulation protein RsbU (phosphoserine phosphatase)
MAYLRVTQGDKVGRIIPLRKVTCFGRGLDMDIRIDDLTVSKRHARVISNDRGEFILEDLASSNGTFLNGSQVSTRKLRPGDERRIGGSSYVFHKGGEDSKVPATEQKAFNIEEDKTSTSVLSSVEMSYDTATMPALGAERNIEELISANTRLRTMLEIFQSIGAALDEDELLEKILDKLFQAFPETGRGFIILRDPDTGQLTPRAMKMARPGGPDEERLQISGTILEYVLEQKTAVLSADAMSDERFPTSQSILDFEMRSVMCAPLMYEEEVLGFILLDTQRIASNYDQEGLTLLRDIANSAALTIANARLHSQLLKRERLEQDLRTASRIQNSFLPKEPPRVSDYQFLDWYGTALEVGGDFYDFVELPDSRMLVVVGDVSGKGISAALMMAKMASNVRFFAGTLDSPGELLHKLNEVALASAEDMFVTVLLLLLDWERHTIRLCNAGHCYPMIRRADGVVDRIEGGTGFPVGITGDAEFPEETIELEDDAVICGFSDGVIEAMDEEGKLFGYKKLSAAMAAADVTPGSVVRSIQRALREHTGSAAQSDDLTLVAFGHGQRAAEEAVAETAESSATLRVVF